MQNPILNLPVKLRRSAGVRVTPAVYRMLRAANGARDSKEWSRAAELYGEVLDADPTLAHIWIQHGHMLRESGKLTEARSAYLEAIELQPDASDPHVHLGHVEKLCGDRTGAARAYLQAARLDPTNADAVSELQALIAEGVSIGTDQFLAIIQEKPGASLPDDAGIADRASQAKSAINTLLAALRDGTEAAPFLALEEAASALEALELGSSGVGNAEAKVGPALVFDVSDLVSYFRNARLPTGIQRVQIETICSALGIADQDVRICAFQEHRDEWVEIPPAMFRALSRLSLADGDRAASDWITAQTKLQLLLATTPALDFPEGAVLINLGTSWWLQNYFLFVRQAKANRNIRYVPFVHDFIPIMASEHCTRELTQDFISWATGAFEHADFFLANSQSTKRDLLKVAAMLGHSVAEDNVAVVRLDADFRKPTTVPLARTMLGRWGLASTPFVLFVSTIESRKNHLAAFEAWISLMRENGVRRVPKLVCVGNRGWLNDAVYARLEGHEGLRSKVLMLSGLSDAELDLLYRNCLFTIYPSTYEGWGLPVTESLCYGKVPLISDASSLPEAGGAFAVYFESGSVNRLTDALRRLIFNPGERERLESGIAEGFKPRQWSDIARDMAAAVTAWVEQSPHGPETLPGAPPAKLGAYHPIVRNFETRIWRGMRSAEIFRVGDGWWGPDDWGCWTKPQGGRLAIGIPEHEGALKLYLRLHGLPNRTCRYCATIEGNQEQLTGELKPGMFKWISADIKALPEDRVVRVAVDGDAMVDLRDVTDGLDPRTVSVGLCGFFLCEAENMPARAAFLEAVALGNIEDLAFNRYVEDHVAGQSITS